MNRLDTKSLWPGWECKNFELNVSFLVEPFRVAFQVECSATQVRIWIYYLAQINCQRIDLKFQVVLTWNSRRSASKLGSTAVIKMIDVWHHLVQKYSVRQSCNFQSVNFISVAASALRYSTPVWSIHLKLKFHLQPQASQDNQTIVGYTSEVYHETTFYYFLSFLFSFFFSLFFFYAQSYWFDEIWWLDL